MKVWFECTGLDAGVEPTFVEWCKAVKCRLNGNDEVIFAVDMGNVSSAHPGYSSSEYPESAVEYDALTLSARLGDVKPDVIHCQGMRQLFRMVRADHFSRKPPQIIITMHSFRHGTPWRPAAALCDGMLFRRCSEYVTPHFLSMRSLDEFYRGLPMLPKLARCVVFPLGVREPVPANGADDGHDSLLRDLRGAHLPRVVYLAEFRPVKRHVYLMHELKPLLVEHKCILIFCGAGPEAETVRRLARDWGVEAFVKLPGHIPKDTVWDVLQNCDVAVCASRSENSPRCVVEPLSMGVPVVTTDVGSASMYVKDFVNGFVVPVQAEHGTLRKRIEVLLNDRELYQQMSSRASASVLPEYSWAECARKTVCMYRAALAGQT